MNDMTRYTIRARSQGVPFIQRATARLAEKDVHRWVFAHSMDPEVEFTVRKWLSQRLNGFYCDLQAAYMPRCSPATLELCDRLSNPLIEVDAVVHKNIPLDCVCDLGYGIAPSTVIDEGVLPIPDYHVLWPGEPTTNTVWTAVEDYTWFEAFSEEGCATGISCTPALHMQSERKTIDERGEG